MSERINRKDLIVEVASNLFLHQGYEATSVRQIADEVGVTEAALYYHFKDGKRELLQAVFACHMPNFKIVLDDCRGAASLTDLISRFSESFARIAPEFMPKLRWLITEYPNLGEEKQNAIRLKMRAFHDGLANLIHDFVDDSTTANTLAWTLICIALGHSQLFMGLNLQAIVNLDFKTFVEDLARQLS
jgi:AcrR family transcriptional regulator